MNILGVDLDTKTVLIIVLVVVLVVAGILLHSNAVNSNVAPVSFPCYICH